MVRISRLVALIIIITGFYSCGLLQLSSDSTYNFKGPKIVFKNESITDLKQVILDNPDAVMLYLHRNKLDSIPKEIGTLINLEILVITSNRITELPDEIGDLKNLRKISLKNNDLIFLPESIGNIENIEELYLNNNNLKNLPESFGSMHNLQYLDLSDNRITSLPESFTQLTKLKILTIGNNRLTSLPDDMSGFVDLVELNLINSGRLLEVPESICELKKLDKVYIDESIVLPYKLLMARPRPVVIISNDRP